MTLKEVFTKDYITIIKDCYNNIINLMPKADSYLLSDNDATAIYNILNNKLYIKKNCQLIYDDQEDAQAAIANIIQVNIIEIVTEIRQYLNAAISSNLLGQNKVIKTNPVDNNESIENRSDNYAEINYNDYQNFSGKLEYLYTQSKAINKFYTDICLIVRDYII